MGRRSDHSREQIREMALQSADRLVREHGYKGLSARKVATDIGYTVGTLYLVFKNQDELILYINERTLDELYQTMEKIIAEQLQAKACVLSLCRDYYEFASKHSHRWLMIFEHTLPENEVLPDWYAQKIQHGFTLLEKSLKPMATNLSSAQLSKAARVLWGSVHGITMLAVTNKFGVVGVDSVNELLDSLVENYLAGLIGNG